MDAGLNVMDLCRHQDGCEHGCWPDGHGFVFIKVDVNMDAGLNVMDLSPSRWM